MSDGTASAVGDTEEQQDAAPRPVRLLPHFIVIGAMKCGTTTLFRHCQAHPDIEMSRDKETDFFVAAASEDRGLDWYSAQFSRADAIRGEASPNYTKRRDFPGVPERMAEVLPGVRLIYIVRDPVARAEAQFRHSVLHGALPATLRGFEGGHEYAHILDASRYARQMDAYLEQFPSEAILVLDFDDLVSDAQTVMSQVFDHVGVAPVEIDPSGAKNESAELSRVPAPILAFAQTRRGKSLASLLGRRTRDRIRSALAQGRPRPVPRFPDALKAKIRTDLADDVARFRQMTGMTFPGWSL